MAEKADIRVKRVYEMPDAQDGARVLVDRIWPRGMTREKLAMREWLKDAAPSTLLRKTFHHEAERWEEFRAHYFAELDDNPEVVERLLALAAKQRLTLLYSAKNETQNNAQALREYLLEKLNSQ